MSKPATPHAQALQLQRHGLAVIEGRQGLTAFRKLVQIRPARPPAPSVKPVRRNLRR